ncbi:cell division protein [Brevibacillus sp. CF112]|uniref:cell division protein FtsX n=1 Tax=Brevibacillus TaxID=55080 RepID=UPI000271D460|nr:MULTISPECIES: permease-like cell division protein FtsX [Brevibacillus]EJL46709.1 cell division protein [Brevibacillus sp. CF112]MED3498733.1 permease-like cell division protein FtsX [Brevibacillus agri]
MNRQSCMYMLRDAREGIQRNIGAAAAAAVLIFVAMLIAGILLLGRFGVGDLLGYLESQVAMKLYVDPAADTKAIATILREKSFVQSAEIETKEQMLDRLAAFFTGREHLLVSFQESQIPDAIRLELRDKTQMKLVAEQLQAMNGITKVVYPQQFAETILHWSSELNRYGLGLLLGMAALAFGMVFIAMNLALYQRQQEIRVRLLLGANPWHVRGQFLFEGWLIGFVGSLPAALAVYALFSGILLPLQKSFPLVFHFSQGMVYEMMGGMAVAGSLVGLSASYVSTRKLIDHA